jgi:hypothetical protein
MNFFLFLDDSRQPHKVDWVKLPQNVEWVIVKNYNEFVHTIQIMGVPKFVAYDCDLCDEHYAAYFELKELYPAHHKTFKQKCGIECAEFLINYCKHHQVSHPDYIVHSKNQYGGAAIQNLISKSLNPNVTEIEVTRLPYSIPDYCQHDEKTISGFFGDVWFPDDGRNKLSKILMTTRNALK